jgi:small multidrug resistance pump
MNIKIMSLALAVFIALVEIAGDFFIKLSGQGKEYINWKWFIPGFIIYSLTAFLWFFAIKHEKLFTAGIFFAISSVIFFVLISVFYFKESINAYEIVGIIFAIIALILLGKFA